MSDLSAVWEKPPVEPRELFRAYEFRTKKKFGQHFLVDSAILDEIVTLADIQPDERVLEVGPGCGTLSFMLLQYGAEVDAIELDRDAIGFLKESLVPHYPFRLHEGDALSIDLKEILESTPLPWKVVANLPYNIGTEVMFRLFKHAAQIEEMTLMFQREVAHRIVAEPGDPGYSVLSLMAQLHSHVHLSMTLGPEAFIPPPRVHSSVVQFRPLENTRIEDPELRDSFCRIVRAGFQMRRKTLANGLKSIGVDKPIVESALESMGFKPKIRPEKLGFDEFVELATRLDAEGAIQID